MCGKSTVGKLIDPVKKCDNDIISKKSLYLKSLIQSPKSSIGMQKGKELTDICQCKTVFSYNVLKILYNRQGMSIIYEIKVRIITDKGIQEATCRKKGKT